MQVDASGWLTMTWRVQYGLSSVGHKWTITNNNWRTGLSRWVNVNSGYTFPGLLQLILVHNDNRRQASGTQPFPCSSGCHSQIILDDSLCRGRFGRKPLHWRVSFGTGLFLAIITVSFVLPFVNAHKTTQRLNFAISKIAIKHAINFATSIRYHWPPADCRNF